MLLADSSVWIRHIREPDVSFQRALDDARVYMHPFVIGELMLGGMRKLTLQALDGMEQSVFASTQEVRFTIQEQSLSGAGIGYVDAHLLVSALLTDDCRLLSYDRNLVKAARRLAVSAED